MKESYVESLASHGFRPGRSARDPAAQEVAARGGAG